MSVYDTQDPAARETALDAAEEAIRHGGLVVLPTDTVYGIGADAFSPDAVDALLEAKGRGRDVPPPVLVGDPAVVMALAIDVPEYVEQLTEAFWPGPLTLILTAQPMLHWDLGETRGTVALRMPDHEVALDLLRRTGPLAVSSANRHGRDAATTVLDAATQLGDRVEVYLDGGTARLGTASTIIDTTVEPPEIVREGALSREDIVAAVGDIFTAPEPEADESDIQQPDADQPDADQPAADQPVDDQPGGEEPEAEAPAHAEAEPVVAEPAAEPSDELPTRRDG
ncbi:threonylcarbamoyl-AMP synthase [Brachybacterium sp. EF45031]|uniref:L-threonylcarbamoyladenylate synthase n=1 Tax=Brachybacterium sillae TaxID=2810536 RepID=UPI00217E4C57|nr:L-threonylcarbamoyladenylate synthase [Brachybacterium sillae]MCS6710921.1 threonylcarbamoyl-AMP synthase [Brachybacterium sillae]